MLYRAALSSLVRRTLTFTLASAAAGCVALAASAQTPPSAPVAAPRPSTSRSVVGAPATYQVDILVRGLHGRGKVLGGLYDNDSHWPEEPGSMAHCAVPVRGREAVCSFTIPARPGLYAAAFFHDEDNDGEIDTGFLGIPTEGYAFSRDASVTLSAPSFESGAFRVPTRSTIFATMRY